MAIVDIPAGTRTISDVAYDIRRHFGTVISLTEVRLAQIRNLVRDHGRSAIATELGDDAAALLTVYAKLKEAVEGAKEITVEDLPN